MTTITPVLITLAEEGTAQLLLSLQEKLDARLGEVVLDFSAVRRIDPGTLRALETLAGAADAKEMKIALRGMSVDNYKVLKLARLAGRFSFVT
jgi:anti-anti-sigma regulatory factor